MIENSTDRTEDGQDIHARLAKLEEEFDRRLEQMEEAKQNYGKHSRQYNEAKFDCDSICTDIEALYDITQQHECDQASKNTT